MIKVKKITWTPTQIYGSHVTPLVALAQPPSGYTHTILSITHSVVFNSLAYVGGNAIRYSAFGSGQNVWFSESATLVAEVDEDIPLLKNNSANVPPVTEHQMMFTTQSVQSVGNSNIVALIVYDLLPIS
jgi:hypothetical protein